MPSQKENLQTNRAALFDWMVILISFSLGFVFPDLSDFIKSPGFFNWMLIALLLYIAGAVLKHFPLSYRFAITGKTPKEVPYVLFLIIGHWLIIFILVILAQPAINNWFHLGPITTTYLTSWPIVLLAITIACYVTWLVYRRKDNRKNRKRYSSQFLFWFELIADILLITGVSLISFVFWEKGVMSMLGRSSTKSIVDIWSLFVFFSILFILFYLPLRYLFFIEDNSGSNFKRLLLIFGFILLRVLFELIEASAFG